MRLLLGFLIAFAVAAALGLGATWMALTRGQPFEPLTLGVWTAWPRTGSTGIDPYARALYARSGVLPLGSGDGVAFHATTDDEGQPLDGRCDVVLAGLTPTARYWTLTLYDPDGQLVANAVGRHGFTSQEIIRNADGSFVIEVAPRARSGNWLPTGGIERYRLVLRLYDTPVGFSIRTAREVPMPDVVLRDCP